VHKLRLKGIAMLLVFSVMFLGIVPQSTMAAPLDQRVSQEAATPQSSPYRQKNVQRIVELAEKRDQHTKYFRNSDGSITAEASIESRHFKDANGNWQN